MEEIITAGYPVGKKDEGNTAYPPLLLFKCLFMDKWFGIRSDQGLESRSLIWVSGMGWVSR